ncbi:MAG: S8 family serine peptidase [Caldilineaceae bacterium]
MAPANVQAQSTQDSSTTIYLPLVGRGTPVQTMPTDPAPAPALVTHAMADDGKWPVQLAASTGAIQPTQHGPQHNDPAEGIPVHAYSPFDERNNREHPCPPGGCDAVAGQVLVKLAPAAATARRDAQSRAVDATFTALGIADLEPIFPNAEPPIAGATMETVDGTLMPAPDLSAWYRATLVDQNADIAGTVDKLRAAASVAWAEPAYVRKPVGDFTDIDLATVAVVAPASPADVAIAQTIAFTDPLYAQQWHLAATNVPQAWQWLADNGLPPGGNRDIVVAVIDTGVDLNHPDLAANLWVNAAELAGQPGVDDDNNGYVDDLHGADMITNSGNPMDDHGHGTHVAGIIAAQAGNNIGGVGVAYNTQIMALKAAQYSGVLSSSDIAEAIYYAVEKGADIINMSFGGYARSQVEEDALSVAFGQAVLVAAAGNDNRPNLPCGRDFYPAAYNWVLGVMASATDGRLAIFSNSDCTPYDTHEYELMAPGVDVLSTLPQAQYAAWDGTSMASPVVAGIAALARTRWNDKDVYSSRFIMAQLAANTQGVSGVANAHAALTISPKPRLSYLEHWTFDTTGQAPNNDDDGIVDAGEIIDLAIVIRNHWGKAEPVIATLDAWADGAFQPDPYVTMITGTVDYGAIGSFNWDDNGLIYDTQGAIVGVQTPFRFTVNPNTPNDHIIPFRLTLTAGNGYDPADPNSPYISVSRFYLAVQHGVELPTIIAEDMTLTNEKYWLVPDATLIEAGVTLTVTEGTQLQFWSTDPNNPYNGTAKPYLQVEGNLRVNGSVDQPVEFFPDSLYPGFPVHIYQVGSGSVELRFARVMNPRIGINDGLLEPKILDLIDHSYFSQALAACIYNLGEPTYGGPEGCSAREPIIKAQSISNSIFHKMGWYGNGERFLVVQDVTNRNLYDSTLI